MATPREVSPVEWRDGHITTEGIEAMQADIGVARPVRPWSTAVDPSAVWQFARGVGDDNPLWWDEAYASATKDGRMYAYPTFLYRWENGPRRLGDSDDLRSIERYLPGVLGLWASDRWSWNSRVFVGEKIDAEVELTNVTVSEGTFSGRTVRQTEKVTFTTADGAPVAELHQTLIRLERGEARTRRKYLDVPMPRYADEDRERFARQYAAESLNRRLLYRELLECPSVRILHDETGIEDTIEAAHWDPQVAQMSGLPRGYDWGSQRISWFVHLLSDWAGDDAFIQDLEVRLRRPNLLGDVTWLTGVVVKKSTPGGLVTCELTARNERDETTASGVATVRLPTRHG